VNRKYAGLLFLSVCIILAVLLVTNTISSITSGIIFAIALILFGGLSKGFQKNSDKNKQAA
jgi:hypothetical protein